MSRQLPLAQPTVAASKKNPRARHYRDLPKHDSLLPAASPAGTIGLKGVAGRFSFSLFLFSSSSDSITSERMAIETEERPEGRNENLVDSFRRRSRSKAERARPRQRVFSQRCDKPFIDTRSCKESHI